MQFLFPALTLASIVLAGSSAFTESICLTYDGTKSVSSVPTYTSGKTWSFTVTAKSTSRKTSTITPAPVSTTTTIYTTKTSTLTAPQNTDTFSSTTTTYTTVTSTIVVTGLSTTITTTSTSTSQDTVTIGTSAGFTPIQSQVSAPGYRPAKRHALAIGDYPAIKPREPAPAAASASSSTISHYPSKVTCYDFVQVLTTSTSVIIATKTATTTLKPVTSTFTSTSTIQSTKTTTLTSASTTIVSTFTSTISTSTTSTYVSTSTVTESTMVVGPTATSFAVCNTPANYLHKVSGVPVNYFLVNGQPSAASDSSIQDEVSCCNACGMMGDLCAVPIFLGTRGCTLIGPDDTTAQCTANYSAGSFTTGYGSGLSNVAVMNGNCGKWDYDINDSYGPTICGPGTGRECTCGPGTDTDC